MEILGMGAGAAQYGIMTAHFYWIGAIPAMFFVALFMIPFYYGSGVVSVPGYLKRRYNEATRGFNAVLFASALKRLLAGYDALWGFSLPYMVLMHQAPTDGSDYEGVAHFHIEFYPSNRTADKLKYLAGSETGAGAFIVDALPEATAAELREAVERAGAAK